MGKGEREKEGWRKGEGKKGKERDGGREKESKMR